jgi:hypothetical protein
MEERPEPTLPDEINDRLIETAQLLLKETPIEEQAKKTRRVLVALSRTRALTPAEQAKLDGMSVTDWSDLTDEERARLLERCVDGCGRTRKPQPSNGGPRSERCAECHAAHRRRYHAQHARESRKSQKSGD